VSGATRTTEHNHPYSPAEELADYLSTPRLPPDADVLAFWRSNASNYPHLADLAQDSILAISNTDKCNKLSTVIAYRKKHT